MQAVRRSFQFATYGFLVVDSSVGFVVTRPTKLKRSLEATVTTGQYVQCVVPCLATLLSIFLTLLLTVNPNPNHNPYPNRPLGILWCPIVSWCLRIPVALAL